MHPHTVPPIYRLRRPWTTALYQAVDRHFETFAAVCDDRFAPTYGPWRPVLRATADAYLDFGRYEGGFVRLRLSAFTGHKEKGWETRDRAGSPPPG